MGFAFCTSACIGCGRLFTYNPMRVPSLRYPPPDGPREPICQGCVARVNPVRVANGLDPIVPLPDAYECCDESELVIE